VGGGSGDAKAAPFSGVLGKGVAYIAGGPWKATPRPWRNRAGQNVGPATHRLLQPFVAYTTPDAWTFTLHQWQVPVSALVSKVVKVGPQLMSFGAGVRYSATSPNGLANGWGGRFIMMFLFPN
jgi:hypothetical protein